MLIGDSFQQRANSPLSVLVLLVSLASCSSGRELPRRQAADGHGKDFPEAALLAVQLHKTRFAEVEKAFGKSAVSYFDMHSTFVKTGEKSYLQSLSFGYAPSQSCYPTKWAELHFRNGLLEAYAYFNERGGQQGPDLTRLAGLRPYVTTRQQVIASLGRPNAESTGRQTIRTDLPGTVAYLWIDPVAPGHISTLTVRFNEKDEMVGQPVIDHSGNSVNAYPVQGLWICKSLPPVP